MLQSVDAAIVLTRGPTSVGAASASRTASINRQSALLNVPEPKNSAPDLLDERRHTDEQRANTKVRWKPAAEKPRQTVVAPHARDSSGDTPARKAINTRRRHDPGR